MAVLDWEQRGTKDSDWLDLWQTIQIGPVTFLMVILIIRIITERCRTEELRKQKDNICKLRERALKVNPKTW